MLTLHLCTKKEDENKTRARVANIIEAKIRKKLDYRDSIFATFAVTMARENVNLSLNTKDEFKRFLDKVLDDEDDHDYFCLDNKVYIFLWRELRELDSNKRDFKNLKIVLDKAEYKITDLYSKICIAIETGKKERMGV